MTWRAFGKLSQRQILGSLKERMYGFRVELCLRVCCAVQDPQAEYEQLPREHELLSVVSQIVEAADRREDAAKLLASKVFTQMFEVTNSRCAHNSGLYLCAHPIPTVCCPIHLDLLSTTRQRTVAQQGRCAGAQDGQPGCHT